MAQKPPAVRRPGARFTRWLLKGQYPEPEVSYAQERQAHEHPWWQVMCLTGVDYFSTLGYQPAIAAFAAGALSPVATLVLVALTLFGALPIYRYVAAESPHGEGSIAMLEHLLSWWQGKLFVLCLLGFVATDFIITITLSAADSTAHILENPLVPVSFQAYPVSLTLVLVGLLGAVFLKGFTEAIGLAVCLVGIYLFLNLVVISVGLYHIVIYPSLIAEWQSALWASYGSPLVMVGLALWLFPKLALGLSGFETGVTVMPLVRGDVGDSLAHPRGRIRNTGKLLMTAALIMGGFLLTSSIVTTLLIPPAEFAEGGKANGRALAYLAHGMLGHGFGTAYDLSTILILWFAGASAMAGLLNIVPRYLPRYGMAPSWARAVRPLVLVYTAVACVITVIFEANVEAQGGAYATGVLVLMSSAALAVTLSVWRQGWGRRVMAFGAITGVFIYTTVVNIIERPEGIKIASFFIGSIILTSLISRVWRSTEVRVERVEIDATAQQFIAEVSRGEIRVIANQLDAGDPREYFLKEREVREDTHLPPGEPVLFFEVTVGDASEFEDVLKVKGVDVSGYRVLRAESAAVPNAIAAFLLYLRDQTGKIPHAYFGWTEGNPIRYLLRFILFGEGDIAPVTREVLRQAEPDPKRRPAIHVGG
ncbi:MAG: amino acid transporter [Candidatus Entotheonellia bacterium]